jgi:hypothetical protein
MDKVYKDDKLQGWDARDVLLFSQVMALRNGSVINNVEYIARNEVIQLIRENAQYWFINNELPKDYKTADYEITYVRPPQPGKSDTYAPFWVFALCGPGWDSSKLYVARNESCGPHLIKALQGAYDAGIAKGKQ